LSDAVPTEDLSDLYENAPCGYVSISPDGRIVKLNRTLADWIGRTADDVLGAPIHLLLSIGGRMAFETHLAPMLRLQGFVQEIALDLVHADSQKIPVIANAAERRSPDGRHLFTRLTLFKSTDRMIYERSLVEARIKAETAARVEHESAVLREQFIAVLGHDLRNPLAALGAGVRMLSSRETLTERGHLVIKEMDRSIARATALIANILDFARGRLGGGITLERDPTQPLAPVLEQITDEVRAIAPDRAIVSEFAIDRLIDCDPARIGQLAANLLSNAVTHGAPGVPVEIEAHIAESRFMLSVANGGVPIPQESREQLFKPFFRGEVRRSQKGLGLGLFIVNEIALAHGGRVDVQSSEQETRFVFSMPIGPV
jgi:sigma-B regulation protein RsbU (phosphoserine phosphatase)